MRWALAIGSALFVPQVAAEIRGEVVAIVDGDTVDVLVAKRRPIRIRLAHIDAPERAQPFGSRSRQHLASLVYRQPVRVVEEGIDRYGRALGIVQLQRCIEPHVCVDVRNANEEMVSAGMAWAYRFGGRPTDPRLASLEEQARRQRRGLWAQVRPIPPWEWRHDGALHSSN
ncbi:thermonuclease family protein [Cupriavidus gilardii]|nr:thermonuclease family protein [Cupriavidus gilardii]